MAVSRHVIVAGAGIAGLTSALALSRAGIRTTVLEQAPKLEEVGAGLQLSPNATRILIELGLGPRLKELAVAPQAIRVMSGGSGREIVRIPLGAHAEQRYGAPYLIIHRGDLQTALMEAVRRQHGVTIQLGARLEDFAVYPGGVSVQARRGTDVIDERGIAFIGADGLWSTVRAGMPRPRSPRFRHRTAWRALVSAERLDPRFREPAVHLWLGPDAHLVHYPVKGGGLVNIVAIVHDEWRDLGWSAPGDGAELLRHFARWSWSESARELIATPTQWLKWALYDRRAVQSPGDGPVTLIGDAAHPMLPFIAQGAGMAIEDAAVLAAALATESNPETALRDYERTRRRRVAQVARAANRQGRVYGLSGPEGLIRNLGMRVLGGERLLKRYDWLYGWRAPSLSFPTSGVATLGD